MRSLAKALCLSFLMYLLVSTSPWAGWIENGIPLTSHVAVAEGGVIISDGSSGAIIAYEVCYEGVSSVIAQRINSQGDILWGEDGIVVCEAAGSRYSPQITTNGAGGAIIAWIDDRNGNYDIYAQRIDASGAVLWQADGVPLCTAVDDQYSPQITSDGSGGAIVTWQDYRSGSADIYAQRVDALGLLLWDTNGIPVCTASESQYSPHMISDGMGGAIVTWSDERNSPLDDIYAQRVDASGTVQWQTDGVPLCTATGTQNSSQITSDGLGGAIISWTDYRSGSSDIYAQRVDASGLVLWVIDGVSLCTAAGTQNSPQLISDGAGGAIVTWRDERSGNYDIYVQRVDAIGLALWAIDGVPLCAATGSQEDPQIISDGMGGAIVTWLDFRNSYYDIYAQRMDALGTVLWQADGVSLCTAAMIQYDPQITSDGMGGAIVAWYDYRSGSNYDIYAQRINASGSVLWAMDGIPLCTAAGNQSNPQIISDGTGGAIVTWQDERNSSNNDIYAQRVDASGTVQWQTDGVPLCTASGGQIDPQITSDGAGGAIVTWRDHRGVSGDIYAQRVDASGTVLWQTNGVPICAAIGFQWYPQIISDGAGGAIVTWRDQRNSSYCDIYAQRIDASGTVLWQTNGVPLCTATGYQRSPQITFDGMGGAIVTWSDERNSTYDDIYAQRVHASGTVQWQTDGVPLCTATGTQNSPQITSDGLGGAIISWADYRSGSSDIYTQRVDASGTVLWQVDGIPLCTAAWTQYYPRITSDGMGGANVTWQDYRSGSYDIYAQRVDMSGTVLWQADGVPLCTAEGNQIDPQITTDGSGGAIVTWQDERCGSPHIYAARVGDSGEIVATLLQSYEALLEGGAICISWTLSEIDEDASFSVLRSSAPDWIYSEIDDAEIEIEGLSFSFTDNNSLPGTTVKYRVDVNTEGMPTRILFETEEITVPAMPLILFQNHPNPFNPNTTIRFYLPEAGEIALDIYNVAGQRVRRLAEGRREKGHQEVLWDGRNSRGAECSSGIYFYRLRAGKSSISRKMVLMR